MPKTAYTQEDYIRAILRSAISTSNNRLESILNKHLGGTIVVRDDGHNSVYIDSSNNGHAFDISYSSLNKKFFKSPQNDDGATFISQAFSILARGKKVGDQLIDFRENMGPEVRIQPDLLAIVLDYNKKFEDGIRKYILEHRKDSDLSYSELYVKAEKAQPKLKGKDYEDKLIAKGFEGRKLQQALYFLDVLGKQYSQTRIIDFLDIYTLYHYYIYRNGINERFVEFVNSNPNADMRTKQITFERIVQQEVQKHCNSKPSKDNAYFDRSFMSFAPRRIDSKRAKALSLDVMEGTSGTKKLLTAQLQTALNVSLPENATIEIEEIDFYSKANFKYLIDEQARRKALEGARLLTTVNCGLFVDEAHYPIVNNDFYSKPSNPTPITKTETKPSTSQTSTLETEIDEARRQQAEEAKKFSDFKQLSLF